jgi:hypothetical protein
VRRETLFATHIDMDFSIILPSRGRPALLKQLLESIKETTTRPDRIEVLVAMDDDDFVPFTLNSDYPFTHFIVGKQQTNFSAGYYNRLAGMSRGRFIHALNDDTVFRTPGWDCIALEALKDADLCYGRVDDVRSLGGQYCFFPILSRRTVDLLGYFFHPGFPTWGADVHLWRVFHALGLVVNVPIVVEHVSHHTGTREQDEVNLRVESLAEYDWGLVETETARFREIMKVRSTNDSSK